MPKYPRATATSIIKKSNKKCFYTSLQIDYTVTPSLQYYLAAIPRNPKKKVSDQKYRSPCYFATIPKNIFQSLSFYCPLDKVSVNPLGAGLVNVHFYCIFLSNWSILWQVTWSSGVIAFEKNYKMWNYKNKKVQNYYHAKVEGLGWRHNFSVSWGA